VWGFQKKNKEVNKMVFRPSMWIRVKGNIFKLRDEYGGRKERLGGDEIKQYNAYQKRKKRR
jgi:hypothetical protein